MARNVVGFGEDDLRALAGARSFERGLGYLDAVSGLEVGEGSVTAVVQGTDVYEVELTLGGDDGPSGWCDCPYGQEGNFCKHCVAVGLTVLRRAKTIPSQRAAARAGASGLQAWLGALSRDELLALVREQLAEDRRLRRRLELRAAAARSDLGTVRERILALIDPSVDVREFCEPGRGRRGKRSRGSVDRLGRWREVRPGGAREVIDAAGGSGRTAYASPRRTPRTDVKWPSGSDRFRRKPRTWVAVRNL
ncbi:SWIM zinc finger domain-containing protein [Streptomyces sp. NPDC051636]|uniref:SWIM zinc finger domain-containing protein n=1 Tax=Streptomyces sp. NPDC051636 TaxID=3365663 RepID=UPI00378D71E7